ncbi:MAG: TonB-dependent receptor [Myxococcales bacterium]
MLRTLFPVLVLALVAFGSSMREVALAQGPAPAAPTAPSDGTSPAPIERTPESDEVDPNALVEPKLLAFVEAGYPEQARAQRLEAKVLLVITIGSDGFVEDVQLAGEPIGYGFDELAVSAARRFVFEPAKRGQEPMRARVRYLYEFRYPGDAPGEPAAEQAAPSGRLELTLLSAVDGAPLLGAEVHITARADPSRVVHSFSDAQGKLVADKLITGAYEISVSAQGMAPELAQEEVIAGEVTQLVYRLSPESQEDQGYGATARIQAPPREVTRRTIEREELTRVAGTKGDALRTIELLPGVSRPPFGAGLVLIRGSAPQDSQVLLNGVPVPLLYHFGGLTSFINSRALQRIDFYPGNFSARYGRQIGGIIDVGMRDPATDKIHGVLDMNVPLDSSLLVEGPITKKLSFLAAGRRSYFGEVMKATIPPGTLNQFAAPVYKDYQLFLNYRPTSRDKIRLSGYGSSDRLEVLFKDVPDDDPSITGLELGLNFHRQQLGWEHRYSPKLDHTIEASYGRINQEFQVGENINFDLKNDNVYLRAEWRYNLSERVQLTSGTDTWVDIFEVNYRGPPPQGNNSGSDCMSCKQDVAVLETGTRAMPGIYSEIALRPTDKWRLIPSMRIDYFSDINWFAFDPRFAGFYQATKKLRIKAGAGVFSQPPAPPEQTKSLGNPNLTPTKSMHYSAGVDYQFTDDLSLGIEGFYKSITNRVVVGDDQAAAEQGRTALPYVNNGIGRIYGLEVAGRKQIKGRWFGFLSYTLMRSQRKDANGPWYLYDFDQTHIFAAAATVILGRGWEAGGVMRFVSGNPETPIIGAYQNSVGGPANYQSVYGKLNSARAPSFNRLDLRVQKTWSFDQWKLALYLDVQNSYNRKNVETVSYGYDYRQRANVNGLPIIPIIGLRGEL